MNGKISPFGNMISVWENISPVKSRNLSAVLDSSLLGFGSKTTKLDREHEIVPFLNIVNEE